MRCEINGNLTLSDVTAEVSVTLKRGLIFDNPAYHQAKKFSKWGYTNIPQFLNYYEQRGNTLAVPLGVLNNVSVDTVVDNRILPHVDYPPFKLELREDQQKAVDSYVKANSDPLKQNGVIQMPTGKGKSILGIYLAQYLKTPTLVIVHKTDLVTNWKRDILSCFDFDTADGDNPVGIIKSKDKFISKYITIATIQTLNRLSNNDLSRLYQTFGCVIQDEGHHCPASSYALTSQFLARHRVCLTATPERNDGLSHVINLYYGGFAYQYKESRKGEKDILPVKVKRVYEQVRYDPLYEVVKNSHGAVTSYRRVTKDTPNNVEKVRLSQIPYESRPPIFFHTLDRISCEALTERVVEDVYQEYSRGKSCIVFFTQKTFCDKYREHLINMRIPESDIGLFYGDQNDNINKEVLIEAQSRRKYITLTTYAKATEGTNVPRWEVAFFVSSINNGKNTEQAAGRIRRTAPDKINPVLIYDYRTPNIFGMSSHGRTRDVRYEKLGFTFDK